MRTLTTKTIVLINNDLKIIDDNNNVTLSIIVPRANLEKMRTLTSCKFISKEKYTHFTNHNAGELFKVSIEVKFGNISKYLQSGFYTDAYLANNKKEFENSFLKLENYEQITIDKTNLYAFGHCNVKSSTALNLIYRNVAGEKISLLPSELNDFGAKKYITFKGKAYSLFQSKLTEF